MSNELYRIGRWDPDALAEMERAYLGLPDGPQRIELAAIIRDVKNHIATCRGLAAAIRAGA